MGRAPLHDHPKAPGTERGLSRRRWNRMGEGVEVFRCFGDPLIETGLCCVLDRAFSRAAGLSLNAGSLKKNSVTYERK